MTLLAYYTPYLIAVGVGLLGGVVLTSLKLKNYLTRKMFEEAWATKQSRTVKFAWWLHKHGMLRLNLTRKVSGYYKEGQ
jgi:hypothetical protein